MPPTPPPAPARPGDVVVTAIGMVSPVGSDAAQTLTSVRAGLRRLQERPEIYACLPASPELDPPSPVVASAIDHLDAGARRDGRAAEWLATLAGHAFADLERRAALPPGDAPPAVLLALPARDGVGPGSRDELAYHFHNHAARDLLPDLDLAFGGHATALALLERGAALVRARRGRVAVGAADSWLFRPWLAGLDRAWRILSDRNPDGFQPGEAAAFVLLETRADAERRGAAPLATVVACGAARVDRARGPATGAELAAALEHVLPAAPPVVVCDLNGESWRTKEWAYAISRLGARFGAGLAVEHPAQALGDVGAATGATLVAVAVHSLRTKHAGRTGAVVWAASDDGERRAVALERA